MSRRLPALFCALAVFAGLLAGPTATATTNTTQATTEAASTPTTGAGQYVPLAAAVRLLDTGAANGVPTSTPVPAQGTVTTKFTGRGGIPATGVTGLVANIVVVGATATGALPAWPTGETRPGVSTVIFTGGATYAASASVLRLNSSGQASFYNTSSGTLRLIVDISGYFTDASAMTAGTRFVPLKQTRALDTRNKIGVPTTTPVAANGSVTFDLAGKAGLPAAAAISAVVANITAVSPTANGGWIAYPAGSTRPGTSNGNFVASRNKTNSAVARLSADGKLTIFNAGSGTTHYILDVAGYYTPAGNSAAKSMRVVPVSPRRVYDSGATLVPAGTTRTVKVAGLAGVPATGLGMVALHVIANGTGTTGEILAYPAGEAKPVGVTDIVSPASSNGFNLLWTRTNAAGEVTISNGTNQGAHLYADVQAYALQPKIAAAPTGVQAVPGDKSVTVTWQPPTDTGDLPVASYRVVSTPDELAISSTTNSATFTNLPNGAPYSFRVATVNAAGTSAYSADTEQVIPAAPAPPGKPFITGVTPRNNAAVVTWTAPPDGAGSVTSYEVSTGGTPVTVAGDVRTAEVPGLANGTTYSVTVKAINGNGSQASDPVQVTPELGRAPHKPMLNSVVALNGRVDLQWVEPADGGSDITGYEIVANPGDLRLTTPAGTTVAAVTGLTNDQVYSFEVRARNAAGLGEAATTTSTPKQVRVPGPAENLQVSVAGVGSIKLDWRAPVDVGTSAVTGYTVTVNPGAQSISTTAPTLTVNSLDPATEYTFKVKAISAAGAGPDSAESVPVRPASSVTKTPVVLTAESIAALTKVQPDGTIGIETPTPQLAAVVTGDLVVSSGTAAAPEGFLKRILRVDQYAGMTVWLTEDAAITDVFAAGELAGKFQLLDSDVQGFVPASDGIRLKRAEIKGASAKTGAPKARQLASGGGKEWTVGLRDGAFVIEVDKQFADTKVTLTASLKGSIDADYNLTAEVKHDVRLEAKVQTETQFNLRRRAYDQRVPLGTVRAGCYVIPMLGVPVKLCPVIRLELALRAEGTAGVLVTTEFSRLVGARLVTTPTGTDFQSINEPVEDTNFRITPSLSTVGRIELRGNLDVMVYGVVGPRVSLGLYARAEANIGKDPWWEAGIGVALGAGMTFTWAGKTSVWSKDDLLQLEFFYRDADGPFAGLTIDPPRAHVGVGEPVTFTGSIVGFPADAPIQWTVNGAGQITSAGVYSSASPGTAEVTAEVPATANHGKLTAKAIVDVGARVPAPVTELAVTPMEFSAQVKWRAPVEVALPVKYYVITTTPDTGTRYEVTDAQTPSLHLKRLAANVTYTVSVRAVTDAGPGDPVTSAPFKVKTLAVNTLAATDIAAGLGTYNGADSDYVGREGAAWSANGRYAFFTVPGQSWITTVPDLPLGGLAYLVRRDLFTGDTRLVSRAADGVTPTVIAPHGHGGMLGQIAVSADGSVVAYKVRGTTSQGVPFDRVLVHDINTGTTWGPSSSFGRVEMLRLNPAGDALAFSANIRDGEIFQINDVYHFRKGGVLTKVNVCIATGVCDATEAYQLGLSADGNTVMYRSVDPEDPASPYYDSPNLIVLRNVVTKTHTLPYAGKTKPIVNSAVFSPDGRTILAIVGQCAAAGCTTFPFGMAVKAVGSPFVAADVVAVPEPAGRYVLPAAVSNSGVKFAYVSRVQRDPSNYYWQTVHLYNRSTRAGFAVPNPAGAESDHSDWYPSLSADGSVVSWSRFKASKVEERCGDRCLGVQAMRVS
ncbi:fibronectin type III domain-containing protein [Kribbella sp. NBC_01245]|uniref:fibronectin type III domain-containing protein n=1 Tax=Kribbella sp. NBC_01245 TaxID=2903578 RepID=UPI002E2C0BE6|nr:fibronectin type III domain-containing protein [Kribbella sp. NBC_01245]